MQIKSQWDTTSATRTSLFKKAEINKDVEKLEASYVASGNIKWHSNSGKACQILKKLNRELPIQLSSSISRHLPQRTIEMQKPIPECLS